MSPVDDLAIFREVAAALNGMNAAGKNRRSSLRYPCQATILLATYSDPLPASDSYFQARCHELSQRGISFYFSRLPVGTSVVVRLDVGELALLQARVLRSRSMDDFGHDYLVSCQFVRRLQ